MLDDSLHDQLAEWVRPVAQLPIPDIRVLRRRARRRGIRQAVTAAVVTAAVAAVGVGVGAGAGLPGKGRPAGGRPAASRSAAPGTVTHGGWQPAGPQPAADASPAVAPYIVLLPAGTGDAQVRNIFTFQTVATIQPPAGQFLAGIAAAGDDRTFVLEAQVGGESQEIRGKKAGPPTYTTTVAFDELRLGPDGHPISLVTLFTLPANDVEPVFAVSQDASMLAYSTGNGFETLSLSTGARRSWPAVDGGGASFGAMAWSGDRRLVFQWTSNSGFQSAIAGVRVLDVTARGDMLQASRLVMQWSRYCSESPEGPGWCDSPSFTADGSKLLITKAIATGDNTTASVEEVSARTGQVLAVLAHPVTEPSPGPNCPALWSDPSGEQVISSCVQGELYDYGRISPVTIHPPMYGTDFVTFAW